MPRSGDGGNGGISAELEQKQHISEYHNERLSSVCNDVLGVVGLFYHNESKRKYVTHVSNRYAWSVVEHK